MTRTGRPRPGSAARDHRVLRLVAVLMLIALAGSLFVSAGSPHHAHPDHAAVAVLPDPGDLTARPVPDHEHRHGNEWTPTLGPRLRPLATVSIAWTAPPRLINTFLAGIACSQCSGKPSADALTLSGLLRV